MVRLGLDVGRAHRRLRKSVRIDGKALGKLVELFAWNECCLLWKEV